MNSARAQSLLRGILLAFGLAITRASNAQVPAWEIWQSPARLAILESGDAVLEISSHCLDGCRYDRSNPGGESGNTYPERWLYRDGGEVIVFDEPGPGAITRLWMTTGFGVSTCIDPSIRVRFYIDGGVMPTLDIPLATLFDGSTPPFTPPLVASRLQSSGGYVSRVPIAYAQSLRVALLNAENGGSNPCQPVNADPGQRLLWFQIHYHRAAPSTPVTSFVAGHDEPAWRSFLAHAGDDPWAGLLASENAVSMLAPATTRMLATHAGPGWLRGIRLQVPRSAYAQVSLRLVFDGDATVEVPLADFFATHASASVAARGVFLGEDSSGWLYAWFPMPFGQNVQVELVSSGALPAPVAVASSLSFDSAPVPADVGRFTATLTDSCASSGDLTLYADRGAGKVVGIAARYHTNAPGSRGYLEGDERAFVDDAVAPAWYGTGIEDFFDGAFYFDRGAVANALSGVTEVDPDGNGMTAAYRLLPTDPLSYGSALRLTQEAGFSAAQPVPTCARSVVYAYHRAQPLLVGYDHFEIGDQAAATAHAYVAPNTAQCTELWATFEDEPPTARGAKACSYSANASHFRYVVDNSATSLRLRRTFDAGNGTPGTTAGSAAAQVRVNGVVAGWFPVAIANPARRWQQQEIALDVAAGTSVLDIEIHPQFAPFTPLFAESAWELRGAWKDPIFASSFEGVLALPAAR